MKYGLLIEASVNDAEKSFDVKINILEIPTEAYSPTISQKIGKVLSMGLRKKKESFLSWYLSSKIGCKDLEKQLLPVGGLIWDKEGMKKKGNIISRLTLGDKEKSGASFTEIDFSGKVVFFRKLDDDGQYLWFDDTDKKHTESLRHIMSMLEGSIVPFAKVN